MFAKEFTHKNGLYTAMHNVKYVCIRKRFYIMKTRTSKLAAIFTSVALYKYN